MLTVISGGQTGVDQAALAVAYNLGYPTGGTAPLGYKTDEGPMPELLRDKYGLTESPFPSYRIRTIDNVRAADFTVWFGVATSPGGRLTIGTCQQLNKPHLINPTAERLLEVLQINRVRILNGAGNRKRTHPEAADQATLILGTVLAALRG
jgi:hypothetical protein